MTKALTSPRTPAPPRPPGRTRPSATARALPKPPCRPPPPQLQLQIKSGTRHPIGSEAPTPATAAPSSRRPASMSRGQASKRDPAGGCRADQELRTPRKGSDCLRASAQQGGRGSGERWKT
uniref:Uncharacterized protein n=1 Tax=Zea mays TaxID=4577 RepID=A0A804RBZ6_MAIZE